MTVLIANLCPNPSFEEYGVTGWSALTSSTAIDQDSTYALFGQSSMMVATQGAISGEGFQGPNSAAAIINTSDTTGVASLYVISLTSASLLMQAVDASTGLVIGHTLATVPAYAGSWQQISCPFTLAAAGHEFYIQVSTTGTAQSLLMWVDGSQYEVGPTTPSRYIDGDQFACVWTGAAGDSASTTQYQNPVAARGQFTLGGNARALAVYQTYSGSTAYTVGTFVQYMGFLYECVENTTGHAPSGIASSNTYWQYVQTLAFLTGASGSSVLSGSATATVVSPPATFDDFSISMLGDPDPAMTYAGYNNAGTSSGETSYEEIFGIFYPPLDYQVSNNSNGTARYLWRRAAYAALGFYFGTGPSGTQIAAGQTQNLAMVQATLTPLGSTAPLAWTPPREIQTIIKPYRLNYCPNPSFEAGVGSGASAWVQIPGTDATIARTAGSLVPGFTSDSFMGAYSGTVTVNTDGDGVEIGLTDLIVGDTYVASCYLQVGADISTITLSCAGSTASLGGGGAGTPYGSGEYSSGYYGGYLPSGALPTGTTFQPWFTFVAGAESETLEIFATTTVGATLPTTFVFDGVLVEDGEDLLPYFDGSYGAADFLDYQWESGGTAGLARSYWYPQLAAKQYTVNGILAQHLPLGLLAATPQYLIPYTQ